MKAAVFIAVLGNGKMATVAGDSLVPLRDLASEARQTGLFNGERVKEAIIVSTWRPPCNHIRVREDVAEAVVKPAPRKPKAQL